MDSASAQKVITDQLKMVLSNQERIMSIISVLQMAIGKIRNQFTILKNIMAGYPRPESPDKLN